MTLRIKPLTLTILTLVCTLPAAGAVVPAAIAQEDDITSLDEDLASDITSDVLDDSSGNDDEDDNDGDAAGDDTNTQIAVPVTDEDQRAANLAANLAAQLDLDVTNVDEEEEQQPPEEEPPEFVAFCLQASDFLGELPVCFNTSEECERAEELLLEADIDIISDCKGVETLPADAINCFIEEGVTINCTNEEDT